MKKAYTVLATAIALLFITGCVTKLIDPRVRFLDQSLARVIDIVQVNTRVIDGGLMEMQFTGYNRDIHDKNIEYRIEWYDQSGFAIKTISTKWTKFYINKKSDFNITQVAPNKEAYNFKIQLRYAR